MYVILVNEDNTLSAPKKSRIMQKSNLIDTFWFIVNQYYNGYDMTNFTITLEYMSPVSKKHRIETLKLSNEKYEEFLKYLLPVDTSFTDEAGEIELHLTFSQSTTDESGNPIQRIRKTEDISVKINPISFWHDEGNFDDEGDFDVDGSEVDGGNYPVIEF